MNTALFLLSALHALLLSSFVTGQNEGFRNCSRVPSPSMTGYDDLICRCNEIPQANAVPLDTLTIDLSDCSFNNSARAISWRELDTIYRPMKVELINVEVYFNNVPGEEWNSTIRRIDFRNSFVPNLTSYAFSGVKTLREIHFFNCFIDSIFENAIENLPFLATLEFAESYIQEINTNAINSLPNIRDIAFVDSTLVILRRNAIRNMNYPTLPVTNDCPNIDMRTSRARDSFMYRMTARTLESIDNLPLPKYGARLLFLRSTISTFSTNSIHSNVFAFAIFGGNMINHMNERALNLELSNQCEITALMFSSNQFNNLHRGALASATSLTTATHSTYLVLTNNTFKYVGRNGFLIHPSLKIFAVEQNYFTCECPLFNWVTDEDITTSQKELERLLLNVSLCNSTNMNVSDFTVNCPPPASTDNVLPPMSTETVFRPWLGDNPTRTTTEKSSSSAFNFKTKCNFYLIFSTFIAGLIGNIF